MKGKIQYCLLIMLGIATVLMSSAGDGYSYPNYCPGSTANCVTCHGVPLCTKCPSDPSCATPVCTDNDGDTYAVEGSSCGPVDCNDSNAAIHPGAVDIPNNGIDENCDGVDSVDTSILDMDGDGYSPATGDCDDSNAAIHPGAVDIPNNGIDENCDGVDSVDTSILDMDGDGYSPAAGDCNDSDNTVYPNAIEICANGIDNDCDGLIDEDCDLACPDVDGDGYRDTACGGSDCNEDDAKINPGAAEICDSIDNNCDSLVDETGSCKGEFWLQMLPVILNAVHAPVVSVPPVGIPVPPSPPLPPHAGPFIMASAQGGGSINPSGAVAVTSGANALFVMTPNTGYKMEDLVIDETSVTVRDRYLFA